MATMRESWEIWDRKNPKFYELFERFTFEAIKSGKTKLSAWLIVNRIRWEAEVLTSGTKYKVSNNYIAFYSRKFMAEHPQYMNLFKTKEMLND